MITNGTKFNLKIFQIDRSYYEFREKSSSEIIKIIKNNHEKKLRYKAQDLELVKPKITFQQEGKFEFWSYCFNQPKEKFYWKLFLPDALTENQNFEIIEFSFVLFIHYKSEIYCVISGSGMSVIKKFIHPSFGIDIYQRIAKPKDDVILELETRGIANNISQKKQIFNFNQTIAETLEYSEVPTKIKLKIRKELKNNEFKKYQLEEGLALLEVGAYFCLRKKLNFEELKILLNDLHEIKKNNKPAQLTLFYKINDPDLVGNLDEHLKDIIVEDIFKHNEPAEARSNQNDIIEVVHPSKLERFYECDTFTIKAKFSRGKKDIEVQDRSNLYFECTKHIFNSLNNLTDRFSAKGKLFTLNIIGQINKSDITYGHFFSHITAEIEYLQKKYFKIDGHWYLLEDEFLQLMNVDAKDYYAKYKLESGILHKWPDNEDEDCYNCSYSDLANYYVLDKKISDNIELCDLLVIKGDKIYLIHIKNGFNTKMRDLYIQVILSAKRLSNDLRNNQKSIYLEKTLKKYNSLNPTKTINYKELIDRVRKDPTSINFVMAFKNNHYKGKSISEKIEFCKSNIAKYALIQVVKEMQQYRFGINLFDISEV
ncbi:MAG: hypothetical protein MUF43_12065 [Flavobacterium sp.]|nr:hypothetical protein [Flavobacterium sp.]